VGIESLTSVLQDQWRTLFGLEQNRKFEFVMSLVTATTMLTISNPLALENLPLVEYLCQQIEDFPVGPKNRELMNHFLAAARQTRYCLLLDKVAFVSQRPLLMKQDEQGRLHSEEGPAIVYGDGFKLYSWHGTTVPADVIEDVSGMTAENILKEVNSEVRRVMIQRFGPGKFLIAAGAQKVHEDDRGTLYRKDFVNDEPLVMVKVINSTAEADGTRKEYFLRVPPAITTAREAVAWTFSMNSEEYQPLKES
jgi:hypothetical protein